MNPEIAECDNCDWKGPVSEMKRVYPDIPDLFERMDENGTVPAGECPKCRALAYLVTPVTEKEAREFFERLFNDLPLMTVFQEFADALERKGMGFMRLEFPKRKK